MMSFYARFAVKHTKKAKNFSRALLMRPIPQASYDTALLFTRRAARRDLRVTAVGESASESYALRKKCDVGTLAMPMPINEKKTFTMLAALPAGAALAGPARPRANDRGPRPTSPSRPRTRDRAARARRCSQQHELHLQARRQQLKCSCLRATSGRRRPR